MILCKDCGILMENVRSFSPNGFTTYKRCPKCHQETKPKTLRKEDIKFEDELHKAIDRRENHGHK